MKKYDKYKSSWVEWIGDIPEHWEVRKLKYISNIYRGAILRPVNNPDFFDNNGTWTYLNIGDINKKEKYINNGKLRLSELGSNSSAKVKSNNLILTASATIGEAYINKIPICIHDGFIAFTEIKTDKILLYYYLNNPLLYISMGKIGTQKNLYLEEVKSIFMPIPTKQEQQQIANYLDKKTAEIDEIIADKENLINLLEEEKEIIISNAVTKGLNPDGEITYRKISHSFNIIGSGTTPLSDKSEYYNNGNIPWVNTGDLNNDYLINIKKNITDKALKDYSVLRMYPKDSLIIAMYGATIGKIGITTFEGCVNQACCVLSGSDFYLIKYVYYWFLINKQNIIDKGYGGGQPNISQEIIKSLKIPFFSKEEQQKIVDLLDKKTDEINQTIQTIKDEIRLIKEYKEILIYEVVTGKIDVREEKVS